VYLENFPALALLLGTKDCMYNGRNLTAIRHRIKSTTGNDGMQKQTRRLRTRTATKTRICTGKLFPLNDSEHLLPVHTYRVGSRGVVQ
jgi:hypothetical protein